MTMFSSRLFTGQSDLDLIAQFSREMAKRRLPGVTYLHPGDVAWQLYLATTPAWFENIRLWFTGDRLVAWAIFEPPLTAEMDVNADFASDELFDGVTGWLMEKRRELLETSSEIPIAYSMIDEDGLSVTSLESDSRRNEYFASRGWQPTDRHNVKYRRSLLEPMVFAELPPGYTVRNVTEADIEPRAKLHREAWSVWGPSKFSASRYNRLRQQPLYNEQFDIVTVAPDGRLLSSCLGWVDVDAGFGHFEPVGTRPDLAGRGFGRAAIIEGLWRMQALGLHTAYIGTASVNERALRLYPACGFTFVERDVYWWKSARG